MLDAVYHNICSTWVQSINIAGKRDNLNAIKQPVGHQQTTAIAL
jgi:hypothetical protein